MGQFRKNMLSGQSIHCDWPYFVGATLTLVLLILRYQDPTFLTPPAEVNLSQGPTHEHQLSLQEIDSSCHTEQTETPITEPCEDECPEYDDASQLYAERSSFKRSILVCTNKYNAVAEAISADWLQGLVIEVITPDIVF
jgi:hypothetical protein